MSGTLYLYISSNLGKLPEPRRTLSFSLGLFLKRWSYLARPSRALFIRSFLIPPGPIYRA